MKIVNADALVIDIDKEEKIEGIPSNIARLKNDDSTITFTVDKNDNYMNKMLFIKINNKKGVYSVIDVCEMLNDFNNKFYQLICRKVCVSNTYADLCNMIY